MAQQLTQLKTGDEATLAYMYMYMLCHVMLCHVMLCHVMSCHVMSCHVHVMFKGTAKVYNTHVQG